MATVHKSMSNTHSAVLELQRRDRCPQWCSSERKPCHHTQEGGGFDEDTHWTSRHQHISTASTRYRVLVYGINADIDNMVKKCNVCQHNQTAKQQEELIPIAATHPWEIDGSDMFHWRGDELVVDYYS